jgi:ribosomal protein S18 acetylase RimI-like enzyme
MRIEQFDAGTDAKQLRSCLENQTLGWCVLAVAPARRRSGAGRALLAHCASLAQLAGRVQLAGEARTVRPAPPSR